MDEADQKRYMKSKYKVKKWESEFKKVHGTNPSKADIRNAPGNIKNAYKTYWTLKTISLETSLVDISCGDEDTLDSFSFQPPEIQKPVDPAIIIQDESSQTGPKFLKTTTQGCNTLEIADGEKLNSVEGNIISRHKPEADKNTSSVWGTHLSNAKKKEEEKKKPDKVGVSSRFTAKLFAGATFNKRNPRKSFIRREKSVDYSALQNLDESQSSIVSDADHCSSQPETTLDNKIAPIVESQTFPNDEDSQSIDVNSSKYKITNSSLSQNQSQPMSLLQKTLMSNSTCKPNPLTNRVVNKGWLDRLEKLTNIEIQGKVNSSDSGIELTDSSVSDEPKTSPPHATDVKSEIDDDDDFICDSDSESDKTKSFSSFTSLTKTKSLTRMTNSSFTDYKTSSFSLSSLNHIKTEPTIIKSDKRTIDHIDDAIVSDSKKSKLEYERTNNDYLEVANSYLSSQISFSGNNFVNKNEEVSGNQLLEIQNKTATTKEERLEQILKNKVNSGKANENFVKINIKKKTYVRGKKTMTFQKYKKQKWKDMKKTQHYNEKGVYKCFKCGDVGHFAKNCMKACDQLLPVEDVDEEEESPFPSLQEAEDMALEASKKMCVRRNLTELPVHMVTENPDLSSMAPPPPVTDDIMRFVQHDPIFKLNEDGSLIDTPLLVLDTLIRFGHEQFRPGQETAVMRVLSGLSTLVTLSTGSGKSLCYQLPAYLYHTMQQRITIVVSPLVSLMEDQVYGVPPCLRVACLHTNQSKQVRDIVFQQLRENSLHALLLSPEALSVGDRLAELLRSLPPIAFACIDEAHCISQWSHNFRPSYLMICQVLREKFGVKTIIGLTATATQATVASVSTALGLPDGVEGVIRDTPLPNNLRLSVSRDKRKDTALVRLLQGGRFSGCQSIIVYCTRRDECQRVAAYIRTCLQDVSKEDGIAKRGKLSWNAEAYHAGLTAARRKAVQKAFMSGKTRIVVATVAFGMGINKQDIQGIIHYNMPSSFERYVQEVGRAGRDGQIAHCHLFLSSEGEDLRELRRHIFADSVERHTIRKLLQRVFVPCKCGEACPTHEVAFSIDETVSALDLPEENIATLLCYLELHARQWVHVGSRTYTQCRVLSYKGPKLIRKAAKECPALAVAVAMETQRGAKLDSVTKLEFPIFPIATAIKWDSGVVKQQLKNLEWTKVNNQPRRSGLTVELHDLGFKVQAPGNLSGEELDCALDSLTSRVQSQEETALVQLQATFSVLLEVSHETKDQCEDEVDDKKCEQLKANIRQYFTDVSYLNSYHLPEVTLHNEGQIISDISNMVNCYRDVQFTGRAIARIFHGITSPNYPAQQWGRNRFWRAHLHEDFKLLSQLATRQLIKMR